MYRGGGESNSNRRPIDYIAVTAKAAVIEEAPTAKNLVDADGKNRNVTID